MAQAVENVQPRRVPDGSPFAQFSGLEALTIRPESNFQMVGERTNVTGSPKFSRLVKEEKFSEALDIARQQVESGANIIDINFDEGLLDGPQTMRYFLNLLAAEPDISRVPVMVDSSKWEILEAGLQVIQGKGIVNSISLKEGEEAFRRNANLVRRYGAGRHRDGVRRAGTGRFLRAPHRDLRARLSHFGQTKSAFRPPILSSIPTF